MMQGAIFTAPRASMPRILITRKLPSIAVELLTGAGFEVTVGETERLLTRDELIAHAKQHDAILCTLTESIDKEFLAACGHLRIISQFGVGYDNIDIAEATRLGIPVGNTPGVLTDATADIAFALMLAVSRKMFHLHKSIINGQWTHFQPTKDLGIELKGKTLGVFGLGRIGIEMAKRCQGAFGMKLIYHNRNRNTDAETSLGAAYVSFNELLAQSDVLSVHSVLSADTRGIFNGSTFRKMKPTSIFLNTARGGIHNEAELTEALQSKTIWGAGLDVTNPEPMAKDNPLLSMENVAVLPHVGSGTTEARTEMARLAAMNIVGLFLDKKIPNQVNKVAVR
jgi:glyoxylate reductase